MSHRQPDSGACYDIVNFCNDTSPSYTGKDNYDAGGSCYIHVRSRHTFSINERISGNSVADNRAHGNAYRFLCGFNLSLGGALGRSTDGARRFLRGQCYVSTDLCIRESFSQSRGAGPDFLRSPF